MQIDSLQPLVSVVMPCYNDGAWIEQSIKSVTDSTYSNIELVIVDDASTDARTIEILKKIDDDRIKVIFKSKNEGVCFTRNHAVRQSNGKYILPVDADDMISKEYIALAVEKLEQNPNATLVCCDYECFGNVNRKMFVQEFDMGKLLAHNLYSATSMYRRCDYDAVGGYDVNMKAGFEDWELWISLLAKNGVVEFIGGPHYFYRIKPKAKSRNQKIDHDKKQQLRLIIWNKHKALYSQYFVDIFETDEYLSVATSMEYRIGKMLFGPIRTLLGR